MQRQTRMGTSSREGIQNLKMAFTLAPILVHPDFIRAFYMETNASDFAIGAVHVKFEFKFLILAKLNGICIYSNSTSLSLIGPESNKDYLMRFQRDHTLRQRQERQHLINNVQPY